MANSSIQEQHQLHFLLIPLMSQSHIIPLTDFAKLLALRGQNVTIITTPLNAIRYKPIIDRAKNLNLKIQLASLEFPNRQAGLPECCENMDSLASLDLGHDFLKANEMLKEPLEKLMQQLVPRPSCIVSTNALVHESVNSDTESFVVPDMPKKIEFKRSQLPEWLREKSDDKKHIMNMMKDTEHLARGVLVNSCEEMEPVYFEEYKKLRGRVWGIGPTILCNKENSDKVGVRIQLMSEKLVKSERVKDAVKDAINELIDGEEAAERRERARGLGELVQKAVEEGGSSHTNITMFIQDVMHATTSPS
ncbi:hypothetical protein ACET3Z_018481 [Daucus carota]